MLYVRAMLELTRLYFFFFGALTIGGGVMGFVKAKSRASLLAGGALGALLLACGYLMGAGHLRLGLLIGGALSIVLAGRFVPGFLKSRKFMPAGLMAVLSLGGIVLSVLGLWL